MQAEEFRGREKKANSKRTSCRRSTPCTPSPATLLHGCALSQCGGFGSDAKRQAMNEHMEVALTLPVSIDTGLLRFCTQGFGPMQFGAPLSIGHCVTTLTQKPKTTNMTFSTESGLKRLCWLRKFCLSCHSSVFSSAFAPSEASSARFLRAGVSSSPLTEVSFYACHLRLRLERALVILSTGPASAGNFL
jgi:hypothetical protein